MTSTELWTHRWRNWQDDETMKKLCLVTCILQPYFQDNMMHVAFGETKPVPWRKVRWRWRVFRDAKKPR